jgi:hypothetical protein
VRKDVLYSVVILLFTLMFLCANSFPQQIHQPTSDQERSLKKFLQNRFRDPYSSLDDEKTTRYSAAFVDLNGDGKPEVIAHITGRDWCGSGGCTTLVLAQKGSCYRVVARLTITRPPIRVLATKSHGWRDIGVWMQGGGIQPGYEADLFFNGKTYRGRDEATLKASKPLTKRVLPGKTVIPRTALTLGRQLFP